MNRKTYKILVHVFREGTLIGRRPALVEERVD